MQFFSSDLHFSDYNTLQVDNRPFKSPKHFDRFVLKIWNKQAKKEDTIYVVGDFVDCDGEGFDSWKTSIRYVKKLKADVVLIIGNNEERVIKYFFNNDFEAFRQYCLNLGFKEVYKNLVVKVRDIDFYLTHKPCDCNMQMLNLFGHIHRSGGLYKSFGFNIGCDLNHFRLFSEKDILKMIEMKNCYWDKDRFKNLKL